MMVLRRRFAAVGGCLVTALVIGSVTVSTAAAVTVPPVRVSPAAARDDVTQRPGRTSPHYLTVSDVTGQPARWNPCRPHTWRPPGNMPAAEKARLRRIFNYARKVTGIPFVETRETPDIPVKFRWRSYTSGEGGISTQGARPLDERMVPKPTYLAVGGWLDFNVQRDLSQRRRNFLYLHEVGHVLNLGHSPIPTQVMYAGPIRSKRPPTRFQRYDLRALRTLDASHGCLNPPPAPTNIRVTPNGDGDGLMVTWTNPPTSSPILGAQVGLNLHGDIGYQEVYGPATQFDWWLWEECYTGPVRVRLFNVNGVSSTTVSVDICR